VINATALLAAVGDGSAFAKGRDLAAWLGLTPRQHSTNGKTKLLGISTRGNKYLRTQLIHGARAALGALCQDVHADRRMDTSAAHPGSSQRVVVALAAKLARIVWAVLRHGRAFQYQVHAVS
jgi:transposase